ncbi:MAG: HAMP domain-containing sensor histidine kinase [Paenibacillus sp.]|uniref:HAMP domain-containing sensor histidine kinase n=1 Tax=Paenibacillus sp. TaxID=58172 RepID=UPI0029079C65|nr:HAMP domain-containing sensor histidine kinase [Paenibacillus sp.]MDU4696055.1 HAMP domain-containing sensor histidine kinase [Paenibacillus sp.]
MIRTIRGKFLVGFFLIFAVSFLLLNQTVDHIIQKSNRNIITDDLIGLKKNSNIYVRQAFLINHFTNDDLYFGQMADEIVSDLKRATSSEVSAYTVDGVLLHSSSDAAFTQVADDDLQQALEGKTAYTISYEQGTAAVRYSYPVIIDGTKVGILRFAKDFTLLYEQSDTILKTITYLAFGILAAAFLFSYILSRNMTIPLVKLSKASGEVMSGNLDVRIDVKRTRRDEIGRLAANFNEMIGQIKQQIARIERDRDRLERLNRQRKTFFDNVTHELKTPLTSILGYAEMIRQQGESDRAFFEKGMNHVVQESERLHGMVLRLLELSQETSGAEEFKRVETGQVLSDTCEALAFKAKRYHKSIHSEIEEELEVYGQEDRIRQIFINLLDNAIKYSKPHSEITVQATRVGETVRFLFANCGETIPPDQLREVFEPYYIPDRRGAKETGSVGLGLGIVKSIVDDHGGGIRMTSENEITTVVVDLPLMKSEGGLA